MKLMLTCLYCIDPGHYAGIMCQRMRYIVSILLTGKPWGSHGNVNNGYFFYFTKYKYRRLLMHNINEYILLPRDIENDI